MPYWDGGAALSGGFTKPPGQCGLFSSVLTSYDKIETKDKNNIQVCSETTLSYPSSASAPKKIACSASGCGDETCSRIDPPATRYTAIFPALPATFLDITSDTVYSPNQMYSGGTVYEYRVFGDVRVSGNSGRTITFAPGDYYFNTLVFPDNNAKIAVLGNGLVRIFVKSDMTLDKNVYEINTGGTPDQLFIYVGGNLTLASSGGGNGGLQAYFYVKESTTFEGNSQWSLTGGVTSEGPIQINGNNPDFIAYSGGAGGGYGDCTTPVNYTLTGPFDAWDTFRSISDRNISTKIVNKNFNLTIASLNSDNTALQAKASGVKASYRVIDTTTGTYLTTPEEIFDADLAASITSTPSFNSPSASRNAKIEFKFCAGYDGTAFLLKTYNTCSAVCSSQTLVTDVSNPCFRKTYSSDAFAIRPDRFEMTTSDDIELLKSAKEYQFTVAAKNVMSADTTDYNQTKANLDLNKTLILKNGTVDTGGLLSGNLNFGVADFGFNDGISLVGGNNGVVGISFDDIGNVTIGLQDKNWAGVDSDDTPQNCIGGTFNNGLVDLMVPEGAYVCGEKNATFIPDHFSLEYATLNNNHLVRPFTYLTYNDDLNMSAAIEVKIIAKNANDETTQNFRGGQSTTYYENPMEVNLTIPTQTSTGAIIDNGHGAALIVKKHDINTSTYLGFGGDDANGTHTISWDDSNTEQRLMFNYNKEINHPINPFDINMSTATTAAQKVSININSRYPESGVTSAGNSINVVGEANATGAATFYFARTRASKDLYDDVIDSVITPISIDVYCALGFTACADFGIDTVNAQIDDFDWWLSLDHDMSAGDGNVTLKKGSTIEGASLDWDISPKIVAINSSGVDGNIPVTDGNATILPLAVGIDLDESDLTKTSSWLIYNKDSAYGTPSPFYKVRFIGVESGWAGHGDTGHVVNSNASTKKNKRLSW